MAASSVTVTLRFRARADLPHAEHLWAEPIGPRRYRLLNSSFFVPLCLGDVVDAADTTDGRRVVTHVQPGEHTLTVISVDEAQVSDDEAKTVTEAWLAHGAIWTEGAHGLLYTAWRAGRPTDLRAFVREELHNRPGWNLRDVYPPTHRTTDTLAESVTFTGVHETF